MITWPTVHSYLTGVACHVMDRCSEEKELNLEFVEDFHYGWVFVTIASGFCYIHIFVRWLE